MMEYIGLSKKQIKELEKSLYKNLSGLDVKKKTKKLTNKKERK